MTDSKTQTPKTVTTIRLEPWQVEIAALSAAIGALKKLESVGATKRALDYLNDRFGKNGQ